MAAGGLGNAVPDDIHSVVIFRGPETNFSEIVNECRNVSTGASSYSKTSAAEIWGLPVPEYLQRADAWPLNPDGELMLGLKIENKRALETCEASTRVPGIAFAE